MVFGGIREPSGAPGVNPSVKLPAAPQPFGSKGPLSRLLGGHFHLLDSAFQRAWKQPVIHHSEYNIVESHSFLERVLTHVAWQYFLTGQDRVRGGKEDHLYLQYHGPIHQDPIRYYKNTAHSITRQRLSSLLTNPHW